MRPRSESPPRPQDAELGSRVSRQYLDVFSGLHGDVGHPVDGLLILLVRLCAPFDRSGLKNDFFDFTYEDVNLSAGFRRKPSETRICKWGF